MIKFRMDTDRTENGLLDTRRSVDVKSVLVQDTNDFFNLLISCAVFGYDYHKNQEIVSGWMNVIGALVSLIPIELEVFSEIQSAGFRIIRQKFRCSGFEDLPLEQKIRGVSN